MSDERTECAAPAPETQGRQCWNPLEIIKESVRTAIEGYLEGAAS